MQWLDISVSQSDGVMMRRLDGRFLDLAMKQLDFDFNSLGKYSGRELAAALRVIRDFANNPDDRTHVILRPTDGQSIIIGADEAAELLPRLRQAAAQVRGRRRWFRAL